MDEHASVRKFLEGIPKNEPESPMVWYSRKVLRQAEEQWERDVRGSLKMDILEMGVKR